MVKTVKNLKVGRPKINGVIKRTKQITVVCNILEYKAIAYHSKKANVSKSTYLRELGINSTTVFRVDTLPAETLKLIAELNQSNSLLNQLARKHNRNELFSSAERVQLKNLILEIQQLCDKITKTKQYDI